LSSDRFAACAILYTELFLLYIGITDSSNSEQQSYPTTLGLDQRRSYEILEGTVDID